MRMAFTMAALVTCIAAQPAFAREEPAFRGDTPAPTAAFQPATQFQAVPGALPGGDFRLQATIAAPAKPSVPDADARLRHRIASSMMDLYPVDGTGFHLSAGMRMFARTNFMAEAEKFTNGLLWAPHGMGNSSMRTGFKRYTPAMTVGYTHMIQHDLSLGLEAGSMLGRAYNGIPGRIHGFGSSSGSGGAGLNPIMNLVVGARF